MSNPHSNPRRGPPEPLKPPTSLPIVPAEDAERLPRRIRKPRGVSAEEAQTFGVTQLGTSRIASYAPDVALEICELIAAGNTLADVCKLARYPSRETFWKWTILYPELKEAYRTARELSAHSLEEEALLMARAIRLDPQSAVRVRAFDIAMQQLRWSAVRRNPREYGERGALVVSVPIQIITPLDLGQSGASKPESATNIYTIEAQVVEPEAETPAETSTPTQGPTLRKHRSPHK